MVQCGQGVFPDADVHTFWSKNFGFYERVGGSIFRNFMRMYFMDGPLVLELKVRLRLVSKRY